MCLLQTPNYFHKACEENISKNFKDLLKEKLYVGKNILFDKRLAFIDDAIKKHDDEFSLKIAENVEENFDNIVAPSLDSDFDNLNNDVEYDFFSLW